MSWPVFKDWEGGHEQEEWGDQATKQIASLLFFMWTSWTQGV